MREAAQLRRENRVAEAMTAYQRIVARWPKLADAWFNLAVLQRQKFELDAALDSYAKALMSGIARPEEAHLNRGVIFSDYLRDYAAAARELEQALTLNPNFTPALLNLANLYEDHGKRPEASALYARILAMEPDNFEALARFANSQPAAADPGLIQRLRNALERSTGWSDRASLGFALGRLLDAAGNYPDAFAAYSAANRASMAGAGPHVSPYDPARQALFVDRMIAEGTPRATATESTATPRPIFIVGMFRSGSTLTEQLLAAMPGVADGGEMDILPRLIDAELSPLFESLAALSSERLDAMAARYRAQMLRIAAGARYVIDKRPDNFLYIGLIKRLFPDARIVHTTRDPLDNCLSIFFLHLEQQMSYALDLTSIAHYYRHYRRLMAHWRREFPDDIIDFDYDALVRDPHPTLEQLCGRLGLEWSGQVPKVSARSAAIRTASVWQVREPLYTTSSGRARHYARELDALRAELTDLP
jgi:hypothetical protein